MMDTTLKKGIYTLDQYLGNVLANAMSEGHQVALWRKPKSSFLQVLIDTTGRLKRTPLQIEDLPAGFIVHPFADQEDKKAFFLQADQYLKIDLNYPLEEQESLPVFEEGIETSKDASNVIKKAIFENINPTKTSRETTKDAFLALVEKGLAAIEAGQLNKIVPARTKKLKLNPGFDLVKSLLSMVKSYPNAFINFFHIPSIGSWMGASPEVLIHTKGDSFSTMALAGTQKARGDNPLKTVAWTQKEIEEQALVSRYIVDCFKKIRLRDYNEQGPKTVLAGNLLHLRSDFKVNMRTTNFQQLGSVMLELLHPTSAVCGMPRKPALDFLLENENFNRGLFAGFIGPVNIEEETSIYVNLRTAQLLDGFALLYSGAGVTEDSIPEKEWEETEMKCEIIAQHLNLENSF